MLNLHGKQALVTGGGSGIGLAIARELSSLGANVAIHYHSSREAAEELVAEVTATGQQALAVAADLTEPAQVEALLAQVADAFGHLDVLVNNAGDLVARRRLDELDPAFFRRVMAVNLDSMALTTQAALPLLQERPDGASIVNLASLAGRKGGHAGSLVYATAKGAVLTWSRALATELAPAGIRVNAVAPGLILGSRFHATHTTEASKNETIAGIPLGRAGVCEDVARAVGFLASETSGFITGATVDINGGVYMA
jgi:3-oxoacyl-[acyl-carrier protein] reductase